MSAINRNRDMLSQGRHRSVLTGRVLSDRSEIDWILPRCLQLARESGCTLPSQYLHVPLLWWDTFNSNGGTDFNTKRGTNFLGARSRLQYLRLLVAMEGPSVVGAVPIVSYLVKVPGKENPVRVITLPGDYQLISRQDFVVSAAVRKEAIRVLLDSLVQCIEDKDDVVIIPYVSEDSPNMQDLRSYLDEAPIKGLNCFTAMTGRRGGVRPWTMDAILSCLRQIAGRMVSQSLKDETTGLIRELAACWPMDLLFRRTQKRFEEKIRAVLESFKGKSILGNTVDELETLLADAPVIYPYIQLVNDRQTYINTLGKATRVNTKNLQNRFTSHGGKIKQVASSRITEQDIGDYLMLHNMRWGGASASLRGDASFHFHKELCRKLSSEGYLTLFFAEYQGKRIAACSCIDILDRREIYLTGRDPEYDKWSAGRLVMLESILDAVDRGFDTYDLGLGWFAYKMAFAKSYKRTWNFFLSPHKKPDDFERMYLGFECMIPS